MRLLVVLSVLPILILTAQEAIETNLVAEDPNKLPEVVVKTEPSSSTTTTDTTSPTPTTVKDESTTTEASTTSSDIPSTDSTTAEPSTMKDTDSVLSTTVSDSNSTEFTDSNSTAMTLDQQLANEEANKVLATTNLNLATVVKGVTTQKIGMPRNVTQTNHIEEIITREDPEATSDSWIIRYGLFQLIYVLTTLLISGEYAYI